MSVLHYKFLLSTFCFNKDIQECRKLFLLWKINLIEHFVVSNSTKVSFRIKTEEIMLQNKI